MKRRNIILTKNIYAQQFVDGNLHIVVHLKANEYHPVTTRIRYTPPKGHLQYVLRFNLFYNMPFIIMSPGPHACGFVHVYHPLNGLLRKGSGRTGLREVRASFYPQNVTDMNMGHFYFNPVDGSFLHFIESPTKSSNVKNDFISVDIYKAIII
jgi:hypothetical protein